MQMAACFFVPGPGAEGVATAREVATAADPAPAVEAFAAASKGGGIILWRTQRNQLAIGTLPTLPKGPDGQDSDDSDIYEAQETTEDLGTVRAQHKLQLLPDEVIQQVWGRGRRESLGNGSYESIVKYVWNEHAGNARRILIGCSRCCAEGESSCSFSAAPCCTCLLAIVRPRANGCCIAFAAALIPFPVFFSGYMAAANYWCQQRLHRTCGGPDQPPPHDRDR